MADVQVIGGGFSGLTAAYFLAQNGHKVRVVDCSLRLGGLLETIDTPYGPVETGANALIASPIVEATAAELGIKLVSTQRAARRRYIFRENRLRRWPLRLAPTLRLLGLAIPLRFGGTSAASPLAPREGESVLAWGERALGREATRYLLCPALAGIYAGDPAQLSARLTLGKFFSRRPRIRGKYRGSVAPLKGMGEWSLAFRRALEAKGAVFSQEERRGLPTVIALPPPAAADFLEGRAPALVAELRKIRMVPLASATVFLAPETSSIPGFGCLFPRGEGFRSLGVLANDRIFPGRARDAISETWILGGANDPELLEMTDTQILSLLTAERTRLHGLEGRVLHSRITRWPRAIPHYDLTLEHVLGRLEMLGFGEGYYRLFGTYLGELGLGSVLARAALLAKEFP